jgi:signal peptidase I
MKYKSLLLFLAGFFSCVLIFLIFSTFPSITGFSVNDRQSPSNWIKESDILLYEDRVVIFISNASISSYENSGSMVPQFDDKSKGVRVKPSFPEQISIGDIVSFRNSDNLIVHRVIEKGTDSKGIYFITQGDKNIFTDQKIRFEDIEYVTVAVLW